MKHRSSPPHWGERWGEASYPICSIHIISESLQLDSLGWMLEPPLQVVNGASYTKRKLREPLMEKTPVLPPESFLKAQH